MRDDVRTNRDTSPWYTFEDFDPRAWPLDGIRWTYLVAPSTGSTAFEMGICRLGAGERHLLHHHRRRSELYYVTAGRALVTIGEQTFEAGPGDAFNIPAGVSHGYRTVGDEVFEIVFVYDQPPGLERPDTFWDVDLDALRAERGLG